MTPGAATEKWGARGPVILGLAAVVVLVLGLGLWATTARIAGAIVAHGVVEAAQERQVVQHLDGGIVAEVLVADGRVVTAGQVLVRLDRGQLASELTIVETRLNELRARRGRLEAERDGATTIRFAPDLVAAAAEAPEVADLIEGNLRLFVQRQDTLSASIRQLEKRKAQITDQIAGFAAQQAALEIQASLIAEELDTQQALLSRGLAQAARVLALQREAARLEGTRGELAAAAAQGAGRITEIDIEIVKLDAGRREEAIAALSAQEGRELELAERARSLRAQLDRLEIRAPIAGTVHGLRIVGAGAVVRPAEPVLEIVPRGPPHRITVNVRPIHIDEVHPGQAVVLQFPGLDMRRLPEMRGEMLSISADAFDDPRSGGSFYRARIALDDTATVGLPPGIDLVVGMPVDAYVQTGLRSPMRYLLAPVADYFRTAFRES